MNKKTYKVIKGYSELTYGERKDIRNQIEKFENEDLDKRDLIIKGLSESLGPLESDGCPCCGR